MVRDKLTRMLINLAQVKVLTLIPAITLLLCVLAIDGLRQRGSKSRPDARTEAHSKGAVGDRRLLDAACSGHWADAKALLAAGSNPNTGYVTIHAVPFTPLGCAVRAKNLEMIDVLLAAGSELNPSGGDVRSLLFAPLRIAIERDDVGMMRE
jgi:ankyrin repeat protein